MCLFAYNIMMSPQRVIERGETQPEDNLLCRLCLNAISYTNSKIIEEVAKEVLEVVLRNLNLEEGHQQRMCRACCSKLFPAFNFKSACMGTEDLFTSYINANKVSVIDLKEVYLTVNGNVRLSDILENQRICRLCLQLVTYGFVSLNEVDNDIIETYIPQVNINATNDPVICGLCFDSLRTHGNFVKHCFKVQEKYNSGNKEPYIKIEKVNIKLEDNLQETYKHIDNHVYVKTEEMEIKSEEEDQDHDSSSHNLNEGTFQNKKDYISEYREETNKCETIVQVNKDETTLHEYKRKFEGYFKHKNSRKLGNFSAIKLYTCDACDYKSKYKGAVKSHQLSHKDPSEIVMYKCDTCAYETKYKSYLKNHLLIHKDPSQVQMYTCDVCDYKTKQKSGLKSHLLRHKGLSETKMYRCDACSYETKRKGNLKSHQLWHKDSSEIQMYKCNTCTYETKYKNHLKDHELIHKDPSKIEIYRCDGCDYEAKRKGELKRHQLTHKDPSEIQMYKCEFCTYQTKYRSCLRSHQLIHKDPSEIQMYKCNACDYETKRKDNLKNHQVLHKGPSETKMYKCDTCNYVAKYKKSIKNHQLIHANTSTTRL